MRRKDREMQDRQEILDVLNRCQTIRLGLFNGDYPYVVPVSFGLDAGKDEIAIYFHCTQKGLKVDCIEHSHKVCVEADIFYRIESTKMGITARYESVIGFGTVSRVEGEEKVYGLQKLLEHYGRPDYPLTRCRGLRLAAVYKIVLQSITGKHNLPGSYEG